MKSTGKRDGRSFTSPGAAALLAGISVLFWGVGYSAVKLGYRWLEIGTEDTASKLLFAGIRFLLAGGMILLARGISRPGATLPKRGEISGILCLSFFQTVLQYGALYVALSHVSGAKTSILNQTGPFLLILFSHMFDRADRFSIRKAAGCLVGFGGIIMANLGQEWGWSFRLVGEGSVLLSSFSAAAGYVMSKRTTQESDPIRMTGWQQLTGGAVLALAGFLSGGTLPVTSIHGILITLYLSASVAVAYLLWSVLLKYNELSKISVYKFAVPIFGVLSSGLLLGEPVWNLQTAAALLLVGMGILIVYRHPNRKAAVLHESHCS